MSTQPHIFISSGEASGDLLGAGLASALLAKNPQLQLTGMGGDKMRAAGVNIIFDPKKLAVVGLTEIFLQLPRIFWMWHRIKKYLKKTKPDLVVLIDFPDTHFRIMKCAKKAGIPVLYYVSPQIWAWRYNRIYALKKYIDHMAVLFSFEEKIYRDQNIPVTFVGHPLSDLVKPALSKAESYQKLGFNPDLPIVTLLPGSRHSEIGNHAAIMIEAVKKIQEKNPKVQFALALANHFNQDEARAIFPAQIKIVQNNLYDLLQISNAAIAVSGTVTLEVALMETPFCILYRFNPITYFVASKLIRTDYIGLCNIVSEKKIAREFIQNHATPDAIANEVNRLLSDVDYRDQMKKELSAVQSKIATSFISSEKVAEIALRLIS